MALAAELFAQRLDRSRPLWDLAFVEGVDSYPGLTPGSVAVVGRVHHAAVDGVSGAEIMGALLDPSTAPRRRLPVDRWRPERVPGGLELAARSYGRLGAKSWQLARSLGNAVQGLTGVLSAGDAAAAELPTLPFQAPPTPLNRPVSARRTFGGVDFDFERLRAVRRLVEGSTINDVVLAICAGALRRWLESRDTLPVAPLVAMVPVSVRGEDERSTMGNQVSAMLVELATDLDDPHLRLAAIRRGTRSAKTQGRALPANRLMEFVPSATAALASRLYTRMKLSERHRPFFNLVITNVPGPRVPLHLAGARIHGHLGTAPVFDGLGLMLVVFSLAGRMSIGITACAETLPDVEAFERMLEESLAALEAKPAIDAEVLANVASRPRARHPEIAALRAASDRLAVAIERLDGSLDGDA
jgi:WS/DGAT/MGAT family acyltransferase